MSEYQKKIGTIGLKVPCIYKWLVEGSSFLHWNSENQDDLKPCCLSSFIAAVSNLQSTDIVAPVKAKPNTYNFYTHAPKQTQYAKPSQANGKAYTFLGYEQGSLMVPTFEMQKTFF